MQRVQDRQAIEDRTGYVQNGSSSGDNGEKDGVNLQNSPCGAALAEQGDGHSWQADT